MNSTEILSFLCKVPLFEGLSEQECEAIYHVMIQKKYATDQVIVHEDDRESQSFFVIIAGKVNVAVLSDEGKQTILATLERGDFFGEMAILDGEPRSASVIAGQQCELLALYRKTLMDLMKKYPQIAIRMLVTMSRRLRRSNKHINTLSKISVYGRIADVLLQLGEESGLRVGNMVVISNPPKQQDLAEMAGTSRETVSRVLSQLRKKHYITTNRKRLVILNEEKLYD
jgi:CRP/FNR family transcriptional regulator/CRP/FNR family cyclic AMP-dependent transcriptional regulator